MDEDKVGLKVEHGEEKKEEDNDNLEVSDEDVDRSNDNEEEDRPKNTKDEISKNLSFVNGVVNSDDLLPLNFNMETLLEYKIIKFINKKLVSKAIDMLHKLVEKDESKKEKDDNIDNGTKELEINKVTDTDKNKLVVDATNDAPPPQDAMATATTDAAEEVREDNNVNAKDGNDENEADNTKGGDIS